MLILDYGNRHYDHGDKPLSEEALEGFVGMLNFAQEVYNTVMSPVWNFVPKRHEMGEKGKREKGEKGKNKHWCMKRTLFIFCSESATRTGWKACATGPFMVLDEPEAHEWLVPKLQLGNEK